MQRTPPATRRARTRAIGCMCGGSRGHGRAAAGRAPYPGRPRARLPPPGLLIWIATRVSVF
eukprot:scaffold2504_cov405-Prasinococcus_capsulatus_cf.AAC.9